MKKKDKVLKTIKSCKEDLNRYQVASLSIFGSVARGEDHDRSDIDILVEFSEPVGIFTFVRLKSYLEELLDARVDLVTPDALKERLRDRIVSEAIRAA